MSERDLERDLELCENVSLEDWVIEQHPSTEGYMVVIDDDEVWGYTYNGEYWQGLTKEVAEVIKLAQSLPWYIRKVRELEEENSKLREVTEAAKEYLSKCKCVECFPTENVADIVAHCVNNCSMGRLKQTIATLDGGEKVS